MAINAIPNKRSCDFCKTLKQGLLKNAREIQAYFRIFLVKIKSLAKDAFISKNNLTFVTVLTKSLCLILFSKSISRLH